MGGNENGTRHVDAPMTIVEKDVPSTYGTVLVQFKQIWRLTK